MLEFSIKLRSLKGVWVRRMLNIRLARLFIVLLAGGVLLSACGDRAAPPDEAELEAGRDTVDAMSREHAEETTDPSPAAEVAPARPVVTETLPYTETADDLVYGYFAAPADVFEPLPAIIVIHEWWGLNDNIRAMAERLAGEGYMVLAVDLYAGNTANQPAEARQLMLEVVEDPEPARENIRAAFRFLETAGAPRIASLGWCFGGGWSLNTAQLFADELDASVIFYGQVTDDEARLSPINAPILGLFAAEDTGIRVESVEAFQGALERLGKEHEIHIYPGVGHAFANPTGQSYNEAAATDAWQKTVNFLGRHLGSSATGGT